MWNSSESVPGHCPVTILYRMKTDAYPLEKDSNIMLFRVGPFMGPRSAVLARGRRP